MDENQQNEFEERDATLDPDPDPKAMTEDELQESILEDSGMNGFQLFIARLDEQKWKLYQSIAGAVLGILAAVALFWDSNTEQSSFSYGLIVAVIIAILIPNLLERKGLRKMSRLRVVMAITLGIVIVAYFVYTGFTTGFKFTA